MNELMQQLYSAAAELWCRCFYETVTWPLHGHYRCQTCFRECTVPWSNATSNCRRTERNAV